MKLNAVPSSSPVPAPRKAQPRKQEQQVNNVPPTASAIEAAASNVDAVENGIHEEEGMLTQSYTNLFENLLHLRLIFRLTRHE